MRIDQRLFSLLIIILAGSGCESRSTASSTVTEVSSVDQELSQHTIDMAPELDMSELAPIQWTVVEVNLA